MNRLNNQRGFALLNVIFLTLITSFAAMILLNAIPRIKNPQAMLRLTAIHLANEQFAMMESLAAHGKLELKYLGKPEDLTTENFSEDNPITFTITPKEKSSAGNLHYVTVRVDWIFNERKNFIEVERTIRVVQ